MEPFRNLDSRAAVLDRVNIDTEVIISMQRLIRHARGDLGPHAFEAWRYRESGEENPDFPLNQPRYRDAGVLVAGRNFGCGSSREMAVWAMMEMGFRAVVAPSFGDIFEANAFQNGMLPVRLPEETVAALMAELEAAEEPRLTIDLETNTLVTPSGTSLTFTVDEERRTALLEGLDDIGMTMKWRDEIATFRANREIRRPWMYQMPEDRHRQRLLILAGDGVGPEILAETRRVLDWFVSRRGLDVEIVEELFGVSAWEAHGSLMRPETWAEIEKADAILFGATGSSAYENIPLSEREPDQLLRIRRALDLYDNLRPVRVLPNLHGMSSLRPDVIAGVDLVIVRELTGGIYFGTPRGRSADGQSALNTMAYTRDEVARIARSAFELARTRRGKVCSVDKANVLEVSGFWREVVTEVHADYPDVELSHLYVDNAAMQLVRAPSQFDVLLTENLFGDILSDCAAMIAGSIGMLPSASLGPVDAQGRRKALYEPIHGSAPDIAGRGIANPLGAILSFAMCLRHSLGRPDDAALLEDAVVKTIADGFRTRDLMFDETTTAIGTAEMGAAVLSRLDRSLEDATSEPG